MKLKYFFVTISLLILATTLSACAGGGTIASSWPGLTMDESTAYVAHNLHVFAVDLANGTLKWRFPADPNNKITFYAAPDLSPDGQLIVGGYDHVLYSLNPDTAAVNWQFDLSENRYIASPLAVDQSIFAPNADKNTYALDLSGKLRWTYTTEGEIWAQPISEANCKCIYLSSMDHTLYALDTASGSLIWQTEGLGGSVVGTPTLSEEGVLYVGTFGSEIIAISARDGSIIWRTPTEGWVWSGPTLANGILYVGDLNGYFYAFTAKDGHKVWQITPDKLDGQIVGSPLVIEDTIYFTSEAGNLYALDTSGNIKWSQTVGGKLYTAPQLAGELILVTPIQNESKELLVAYSKDGVKKWAFIPPEEKKK